MNDTHHKIFLSSIKNIVMDKFPTFVGICFTPHEYADLLDIACSRLLYYYGIDNKPMTVRYLDFILLLRTRKSQKYYNEELYKLLER